MNTLGALTVVNLTPPDMYTYTYTHTNTRIHKRLYNYIPFTPGNTVDLREET